MSHIDIFISHSSQDAELAEALITLLRSAMNIPAERIRCTSLNGYRLPAGVVTEDQLRQEVLAAKAFIGILTPSSLQSTFVFFELGARWGAGLHLVPLLASGTTAGDLQRPLSLLNALDCASLGQLYQLIDEIAATLGLTAASPASYQTQLDSLIQKSRKKLFEVNQWIATDKTGIQIGLSSPIDKLVVHETLIKAYGRVSGIADLELGYRIQAVVFTNKEYPQGTGIISKDGLWRIQQIHLGSTSHIVFFRIFDNKGRRIAESEKITVIEEDIVT